MRPLVAFLSGLAAARWGRPAAVLALPLLESLAAVTAGILYYGEDAVHVGLSVYAAVPAALALAALYAWERSRWLGLLGFTGSLAYMAGVVFFPSPAAPLGAAATAAAVAAAAWPRGRLLLGFAAVVLLAAALALGGSGLWANISILSYPLKPSSYSQERWSVACMGRGDAMMGVHDPERLRIVHACVAVRGVVASPPFLADDGDYCFDLRVDWGNATPLLSTGNLVMRRGMLHVEIIPRDLGILRGLGGGLCVGDVVEVVGVHVVDTDHAQWAEIHPALEVRLLRRGPGPCVMVAAGEG